MNPRPAAKPPLFLPQLVILLLTLAACPALAGQNAPHAVPGNAARTQPVIVLSRLPHNPEAFTQGLLLHGGLLYESTGLYGQSSLRCTDPRTGRELTRRDLSRRLFGEGLALCEGSPLRLVQLTWREGLILTYDLSELRPTSQGRLRGQGWGLACQGGELALSDGSDTLRFLNAQSLAETGRTLRVRDGARPIERLNELEWVNGWLVANIWGEDRIAVIRPGNAQDAGQVALWLDLAPLRRELSGQAEAANGIAFDPAANGGRGALYLTGKRWETLFVVALPELMRQPPSLCGSKASAASGTAPE